MDPDPLRLRRIAAAMGTAATVNESFEIAFATGTRASAVHVDADSEAEEVIDALGLGPVSGALVVAGGADGLDALDGQRLQPLFALIAVLAEGFDAAVIDGGTDVGAMRLMGQARAERGDFPLLGVVVARLAALPGAPAAAGTAELEPHHSHFALVPGSQWGDEVPWVVRLADAVAGSRSATLVVNGGPISWSEAVASVEAGRPVVTLDGTGRAADALAAAVRRGTDDAHTRGLVASGLLHTVHAEETERLVAVLEALLSERP